MSKTVDIANSKFVGFTEERLLKRKQILTNIIGDEDALDDEIEDAARLRKEVNACLKVFAMCQELGLDTDGMTVADILEQTTGESIVALQKNNAGGALGQDIVSKSGSAVKKTAEASKKGLNKFGNWLSNL